MESYSRGTGLNIELNIVIAQSGVDEGVFSSDGITVGVDARAIEGVGGRGEEVVVVGVLPGGGVAVLEKRVVGVCSIEAVTAGG